MARIKLEDIKEELSKIGWKVLSTTYSNLDEEMIFECEEGHKVYSNWKKIRNKPFCPTCAQNHLKNIEKTYSSKKKDTYRVLALDQATYDTGFSIYDNKELVTYGEFNTNLDTEAERNHAVKVWLLNMIKNWQPDLVGIEDIQMQQLKGKQVIDSDNVVGIQTFKTLAHLQGVLIETCIENNVNYKICPTPTWRSHCGVKGKTRADKKKSMQLLVKNWHGISVEDNIADAIGIGKYTAETGEVQFTIQDWED